jgi:transposase
MYFTISTRAKELERRRQRAGEHFNRGKSEAWVARHFKVSAVAAWKWHRAWKKDKKDGLKSKGRCGAKKKLTKEKLRTIDRLLQKGAEHNGFPSPLWTLNRVAELIRKEAHVVYHPGHIWKILRSAGWTSQKPVRRARERNETAIRMWYKGVWPTLKKGGSVQKQPSVSLMKQDSLTAQ